VRAWGCWLANPHAPHRLLSCRFGGFRGVRNRALKNEPCRLVFCNIGFDLSNSFFVFNFSLVREIMRESVSENLSNTNLTLFYKHFVAVVKRL